ncbi:MAG: DUF2905 domain-containing protein [Kosmotoga sp.]|uniref:DUF2905 domain-containing protein n=1 Tax=Kosmotoga sp. TaxID=1955248 RepID=UPI001DDB8CF4|nr:DUF2905 domain-containing protein [Kosmotoga sp.]MBO8166982.1 DUF2905 domain-containing protein [Kosmotoga sp.]MCD6159866.1 DUF2905 domain-containing protein [Kosmotoga sp.]
MASLERILLKIGLLLIFVSIISFAFRKLGLQLGKLPGDIKISKDGFEFWFPLTTSLLISGAITGIYWLFKLLEKLFK